MPFSLAYLSWNKSVDTGSLTFINILLDFYCFIFQCRQVLKLLLIKKPEEEQE